MGYMASKQISAAVVVSNGKKSAKWFGDSLGFETSVEDHWVTVWPKGSTAKLHLCEGDLEPGNTGIAFYFEDLGKEAAKLKEKKVKFTQDVKKQPWGSIDAKISDPDGNIFWLIQGEP